MKTPPYLPLPPDARVGEQTRMQFLIYATLSHLECGVHPDPAWEAEWAALLARRVQAEATERIMHQIDVAGGGGAQN